MFHLLSPLATGLSFLPLSLGAFHAAANSHRLQRRLGTDRTTALGALIMTVGLAAIWTVSATSFPATLITASGIFGIGVGITLASIADGMTHLFPAALAGAASGALTTAQQFGNSLGLAIVAVADNQLPTNQCAGGFAAMLILSAIALILLATHAREYRNGIDDGYSITAHW